MPRTVRESSYVTLWFSRRSPSERTVNCWSSFWLIGLFFRVIFRRATSLPTASNRRPGHGHPSSPLVPRHLELRQAVDRRLDHVHKVRASQRLGEDVLDA